jgi:capsule polysaccharide export protein KpsE/RkpR
VSQIETKSRAQYASDPDFEVAVAHFRATGVRAKLVESLRLLWVERRFIGRLALVGVLSGTLIAFLLPKQFQSTAQLMPPDSGSGSGAAMLAALTSNAGSGVGGVAGSLLDVKSSGALFVGILGSRTVEDRLVQHFDLKQVYGLRLEEDATKKLAENTGIAEDHKSGIITITVTDRDSQRATAIAQSYVEELNRLAAELSTSAAHREKVFLEQRLAEVKVDLDQASRDFSQFASKNTAIDIKEQAKAMVEAAATLQGQVIAAESQLKGLEEIYTSNNVRVRSVQARITELQQQLDKLGARSTGEAGVSAKAGSTLYPSIRDLPLLGVTYEDLFRRTKIQEAVYETLTQEYELAKVQEAKDTPSVRVLDSASVPERKSFPPRMIIILLSAFAACGAGAMWLLGRARWEQIDPEDTGKALASEVVQKISSTLAWKSPQGSRMHAWVHGFWAWLIRRPERDESA